jgi:hypothetical protein
MLPLLAVATVVFFFSIVPTATYLYAERRSRAQWVEAVDATGVDADRTTRPRARAPIAVRAAAWGSLALGQLAIPWLLVPGACVVVLLGLGKVGAATTTLWIVLPFLAVAAALQAIVAFRLFPFGIRLLARDKAIRVRARSVAGMLVAVNLAAVSAAGLGFALIHIPRLVHPVLATVLRVGIVLPVAVFGVLGLASALLVVAAGYAAAPAKT